MILKDWNRKLIAFLLAIIIWTIVNQSITVEITIPNVSIKVVNLPADKTIEGISPRGILPQKVPVTIFGTKYAIENITSEDIQIVIDADKEEQQWIDQVNKRTLKSTNAEVDVIKSVKKVSPVDIPISISNLITEVIPVKIVTTGVFQESEYQFIDILPQKLNHTVTGPEKQVLEWKKKNFELVINLNNVSKDDLDYIKNSDNNSLNDEISLLVPRSWKKIYVPFVSQKYQEINDPRANDLRMQFLKKNVLPIGQDVSLHLFYPVKHSDTINPSTYPLNLKQYVEKKNGIFVFSRPLFVKNVSPLFLDIVKNFLAISVIVMQDENSGGNVMWNKQFVNIQKLEEKYIQEKIKQDQEFSGDSQTVANEKIFVWKNRFKNYADNLVFVLEDSISLELNIVLKENGIYIYSNDEVS